MKGFVPPPRLSLSNEPLPITRSITIAEGISVKDLAEKLEIRAKDLIAAIEKSMKWEVRQFKGHTDQVLSVAFDKDGKRCASGGFDKTIRIWNVETGKEIESLDLGQAGDVAKHAVLTADGSAALTGTANWLVLRFEVGKH